jgi:hypothetical protein
MGESPACFEQLLERLKVRCDCLADARAGERSGDLHETRRLEVGCVREPSTTLDLFELVRERATERPKLAS